MARSGLVSPVKPATARNVPDEIVPAVRNWFLSKRDGGRDRDPARRAPLLPEPFRGLGVWGHENAAVMPTGRNGSEKDGGFPGFPPSPTKRQPSFCPICHRIFTAIGDLPRSRLGRRRGAQAA
jgi:hypothetical protein